MDKAEAEMREILAGEFANAGSDASRNKQTGELLISDRIALRAMAAYGDLRARKERERCAKVAEEKTLQLPSDSDMTRGYSEGRLAAASAIRSLKPETPNG